MGIDPIKIPKSSRESEVEMVRLSFRDVMWYCYLEQSHLDSSFYWLKTTFKDRKSRYVLNFVVGAYTQKLNELGGELAKIRQLKAKRIEDVQNLRTFLRQFGYSSEQQILQEIATSEEMLSSSSIELKKVQEGYSKETHFVDDLREHLRVIERNLSNQEKILIDLKTRISEQTSLKEETDKRKIQTRPLKISY